MLISRISLDLDDGVKINCSFGDLAEVKGYYREGKANEGEFFCWQWFPIRCLMVG